MRTLLAKERATGKWFQCLATGEKQLDRFAADIAAQFSVLVAEVIPEERQLVTESEYLSVQRAFAAGLFEGQAVIAASPATPSPDPNRVLKQRIDAALADVAVPQSIKSVFMELKSKLGDQSL